jgi:hypothetical protein
MSTSPLDTGHVNGRHAPRQSLLLWLALPLLFVAAVFALSRVLPLALIDFEHYYQASHALWQRQNPYGVIEFFAPPWMALVLGPLLLLPLATASAAWVILLVVVMGGTAALSTAWLNYPLSPRTRLLVLALTVLAPSALFVYITGQVTGLVALAALLAAWLIATRRAERLPWLVAAALWLTLLKPHIVALLVLLCGLELLRRRAWRVLAWLACLCAAGALFGLALLPAWPSALWSAWRAGAYLGGPGLVAAGYRGLREVGVSWWLWLPLAGYVVYAWRQRGLTAYVAALALPVGLLLVPYHRAYDQVVLFLPVLSVFAFSRGHRVGRRWLARGLALAALVAPLAGLDITAPMLAAIAILLVVPTATD